MRQDERNNIISLEEKQINGKREEELKASMKQQEVPVPDILKPEQIRKRLEEMQTKEYESRKKNFSNKRMGKVWTGVAAGIVLVVGAVIGGGTIFHQNQSKKENQNKSGNNSYNQAAVSYSNPDSGEKPDNNSYKEAYEALQQYYQYYYADMGEESRGLSDGISDFINGIADTFGEKKYNEATTR